MNMGVIVRVAIVVKYAAFLSFHLQYYAPFVGY